MNTDGLIDLIVKDPLPMRPARAWRVLAPTLPVWLLVLGLVLTLWRLQPAFAQFASTPAFQLKMLWLLTLLAIGLWALWRLARPTGFAPRAVQIGWPLVLSSMAVPAVWQSLSSPSEQLRSIWLGQSWWSCLASLGFLSLPLLAVLLWVLHGMAPTRPAQAGAMAGLAAASMSAMAYSLHCNEAGYGFFLLWYGGSLLGLSALGAALGRRWLRW